MNGDPAFPPVEVVRHVRIRMSDGVELDADLFLPAPDALTSGARWPVVFDYYPYRKDDLTAAGTRAHRYLARRGLLAARIDVRGTGSSGGTAADEYCRQEQDDAVEAIAWLAAQPWSNGNVGMFGSSYGGFNSLQVAMRRPPALKAIVAMYFTDNRYTDDCHYKGGSMQMLFDVATYGLAMVPRNALPPDSDATGVHWATTWEQHLEAEPWLLNWVEHQVLDDYWKHGSLDQDYGAVTCATYLIGGWRDGYTNCNLRTFARLTCPKKVLVGPWLHSWPDAGTPGPRIDHLHEHARFFEHWLAGAANGVMDEPPVTVYMQRYDPPAAQRPFTSGEWRAEAGWPLERAAPRTLHLGSGAQLLADPDPATETVGYDYDPTVGTSFGMFSASSPYLLPTDQRAEDARSLTWTTDPLTVPLEILGQPMVRLRVSVTAEIATVVVRLIDVAPDGPAALVTKGLLNLTHRDSHESPTPVVPGQALDIDVELDATSWMFEPGHRIRVAVTGADYPNAWPSPYRYRGEIHVGAASGSALVLPVAGPPAAPGLPVPALRPAGPIESLVEAAVEPPSWRVTRDQLAGTAEVFVRTAGSTRISGELRVTTSGEATTSVAEQDPAHASVRGASQVTLESAERTVTARARGQITSDATTFHVAVQLDVSMNDLPVHSRAWLRSYPRRLL